MTSISKELISDDDAETTLTKTKKLVEPLEKLGSKIYISYNNNEFYSTSNKADVLSSANAICDINLSKNTNYFGENGIVIVTHAENENGTYLVLITNDEYEVTDASAGYSPEDFTSLVFGKSGLILFLIILIFSISILVLSLITSSTIVKPIKKLAKGANEIASGNLDYVIDYNSTNEIGETVDSFNNMTEQLKASINEQSQLEKSRKEMIAGLAHDIRTPLTSAKGYVEGLLDGIAKTPEMQKRYLETVYSSTCDIERMTNELLTVSRLELGTLQIVPTPINIIEFMNDCASDISMLLEKNNFDFSYNKNCDDTVICNLDSDNFTRVIRNIISNSIKYSKPDEKGRIDLSIQEYQKSIIITIADNGIGLDAESLPKIFNSMYRADKARSNVRDGSGIGLAICKQIVELHGGHIWATSKEGEGLTIHISLEKRTENE